MTEAITDFYEAWWFIEEHPKMKEWDEDTDLMRNLEIMVVKVNPYNEVVEEDKTKNTATRVWLEFGFKSDWGNNMGAGPTHDVDLDCGAPTFEEALIEMANLIKEKYPVVNKGGVNG